MHLVYAPTYGAPLLSSQCLQTLPVTRLSQCACAHPPPSLVAHTKLLAQGSRLPVVAQPAGQRSHMSTCSHMFTHVHMFAAAGVKVNFGMVTEVC